MNRRQFIRSVAGAALLARCPRLCSTDEPRAKAPFRVLYSNDTTNILSCISPYHKKSEPFRPEMLEATVDEVAGLGVDAHLLQPGLGEVPLWPSKVYPLAAHAAWLEATYGLKPDPF